MVLDLKLKLHELNRARLKDSCAEGVVVRDHARCRRRPAVDRATIGTPFPRELDERGARSFEIRRGELDHEARWTVSLERREQNDAPRLPGDEAVICRKRVRLD